MINALSIWMLISHFHVVSLTHVRSARSFNFTVIAKKKKYSDNYSSLKSLPGNRVRLKRIQMGRKWLMPLCRRTRSFHLLRTVCLHAALILTHGCSSQTQCHSEKTGREEPALSEHLFSHNWSGEVLLPRQVHGPVVLQSTHSEQPANTKAATNYEIEANCISLEK